MAQRSTERKRVLHCAQSRVAVNDLIKIVEALRRKWRPVPGSSQIATICDCSGCPAGKFGAGPRSLIKEFGASHGCLTAERDIRRRRAADGRQGILRSHVNNASAEGSAVDDDR